MNKLHGGTSDQDNIYSYTYNIYILSVKMKVKFQCKMKIQIDGQAITKDVPITDGCFFIFNQDCTLIQKDKSTDYFTLSINILTNKGAKYIAAIANLQHRQLSRIADTGPSSKLVINLTKCLDPDGYIQLNVKQAFRNQNRQRPTTPRESSKLKKNITPIITNIQYSQAQSRKMIDNNWPTISPHHNQHKAYNSVTKSQINAPRGIIKPYNKPGPKRKSRDKSIHSRQKSYYQSGVHRVQKDLEYNYLNRQRRQANFIDQSLDLPVTTRQSYIKLKQKLKKQERQAQKQHQKRINLQTSQATTKLQALRFKLKCEQLQKHVQDKNGNIKKLQKRRKELERYLNPPGIEAVPNLYNSKNLHLTSAKTLYNPSLHIQTPTNHNMHSKMVAHTQKDEAIQTLQSKISIANRQLQDLKAKLNKSSKSFNEKELILVKQIQMKNSKIGKLQQQIINLKRSNPKTDQSLKLTLQSKTRVISQLQRQHEQLYRKLSQSEKTIKILQKNLEQHRNRIEELTRNASNFTVERQKLTDQIHNQQSKLSISQLALANNRKLTQKLQSDMQALLKVKQKYQQSLIQVKRIQGEHRLENKHHENTAKQLQKTMQNLQNKHKQEIEIMTKRNNQIQSKSIQQTIRIKEMQNQINIILKSEMENQKRSYEKLQRECDELRNNEKLSKKQSFNYENKIGQSNTEIELWKNKFKSLQSLHALQMQKYENQINHLKQNLDKQIMGQLAFKQKQTALTSQLSTMTIRYSNLQQKYNKQTKQLNQKLESQINKTYRQQESIKNMQGTNNEYRSRQKQLYVKIQQYQNNQKQYKQIITRYQKQLNRLKSLLTGVQQKLKKNSQQAQSLLKNNKQLSQKNSVLVTQSHEYSYKIKSLQTELHSENSKCITANLELGNLKKSLQIKQQQFQKMKSNYQQQIKNKAEMKEQLMKNKLNSESFSNQYDRFKEQIWELINRQFGGDDSVFQNSLQLITKPTFARNATQIMGKPDAYANANSRRSPKVHTLIDEAKIVSSGKTLNNYSNYLNSSPKQYKSVQSNHIGMQLSGSVQMLSNSEIIGQIGKYANHIKKLYSKLVQQFHIMQKQLQLTKESHQQRQEALSQELDKNYENISKLEEELTKSYNEKELLQRRYNELKLETEEQIFKLKAQVQKTKEDYEDEKFTCSAVRIQKQNEKQYYQQKLAHLIHQIRKLENLNQSMLNKNNMNEQAIVKYKAQIQSMSIQNKKYKQDIQNKEGRIKQLQNDLYRVNKLYEDMGGKNKGLLNQISQLQLVLTNQRENNGRNREIIQQEEKKLSENKDFINNLIRQKQSIVKQQIANSQKIIQLESIKFSQQSQLQSLTNRLQIKCEQLAAQKETIKRVNSINKELQMHVQKLNENNHKLGEQLKYKQKQLQLFTENYKNRQVQYSKEMNSKNKEIEELLASKERYDKLYEEDKKNYKKEISRLESEVITKLQQQVKYLSNSVISYKKQLQNSTKELEEKNYQLNSYKQVQEKQARINQSQLLEISQLSEQLKQKEQQLYSISGQLYTLQQKFYENQMAAKLEKQRVEQEFQYKYDNMCEDYQTKIDQMERQREYLKQKITIADQEINKLKAKLKNMEEQDNRHREHQRQKYVKSQQQKNNFMSSAKSEVKRVQQNKQKLQAQIKRKQIEVQQLKSLQAADKNLIKKLEIKLRQCQLKLQQNQSQSFNQLQSQKKKQVYIKQFEESVTTYQWVLQRQIKKQLQNITKFVVNIKLNDSSPNGNNQNAQLFEAKKKVTDAIKDMEYKLARLVSEKITVNSKTEIK